MYAGLKVAVNNKNLCSVLVLLSEFFLQILRFGRRRLFRADDNNFPRKAKMAFFDPDVKNETGKRITICRRE